MAQAQVSGVQNAIRELEEEQKRIEQVITMLKSIHGQRVSASSSPSPSSPASNGRRRRRRLSAEARRRISEAAKKRWAALRSSKQSSKK